MKTGDSSETKVGEWAIPLEEPARFWAPDDIGCDRKAVMHRYAEPKHFLSASSSARRLRAPARSHSGR